MRGMGVCLEALNISSSSSALDDYDDDYGDDGDDDDDDDDDDDGDDDGVAPPTPPITTRCPEGYVWKLSTHSVTPPKSSQ